MQNSSLHIDRHASIKYHASRLDAMIERLGSSESVWPEIVDAIGDDSPFANRSVFMRIETLEELLDARIDVPNVYNALAEIAELETMHPMILMRMACACASISLAERALTAIHVNHYTDVSVSLHKYAQILMDSWAADTIDASTIFERMSASFTRRFVHNSVVDLVIHKDLPHMFVTIIQQCSRSLEYSEDTLVLLAFKCGAYKVLTRMLTIEAFATSIRTKHAQARLFEKQGALLNAPHKASFVGFLQKYTETVRDIDIDACEVDTVRVFLSVCMKQYDLVDTRARCVELQQIFTFYRTIVHAFAPATAAVFALHVGLDTSLDTSLDAHNVFVEALFLGSVRALQMARPYIDCSRIPSFLNVVNFYDCVGFLNTLATACRLLDSAVLLTTDNILTIPHILSEANSCRALDSVTYLTTLSTKLCELLFLPFRTTLLQLVVCSRLPCNSDNYEIYVKHLIQMWANTEYHSELIQYNVPLWFMYWPKFVPLLLLGHQQTLARVGIRFIDSVDDPAALADGLRPMQWMKPFVNALDALSSRKRVKLQ